MTKEKSDMIQNSIAVACIGEKSLNSDRVKKYITGILVRGNGMG